mgnify:CR=1 FL=1
MTRPDRLGEVALRDQVAGIVDGEWQLGQRPGGGPEDDRAAVREIERRLVAGAQQVVCRALVEAHRAADVSADLGVGDDAVNVPVLPPLRRSDLVRTHTHEHHGRPGPLVLPCRALLRQFEEAFRDHADQLADLEVAAPSPLSTVCFRAQPATLHLEGLDDEEREERLDVLDRRIDEMGLDRESYWWYRDLRRYGTIPHAGFGLGFERTVQYATGMANIRDVIPFPRTPGNAEF